MSFLSTLFADLQEGEYIELRYQKDPKNSRSMRAFFYASVHEAEEAAQGFGTKGHLYFGIAPRAEKRGTKAAIQRVQALWADLDDVKVPPPLVLPPTFVVNSGHGLHLYWLLVQSVDPPTAEALNKRLAEAVKGDAVADCSRIFRYPGTRNYKHTKAGMPCEILASTPCRFTSADVSAALKVPRDIVLAIHDPDASESKSRSEKDYKIVMALRAAGMSPDGIAQVMLHSPCGDKARESKHYLDQTIKKVFAQEMPAAPADEGDAILIVQTDGFYLDTPGGRKRLSSFVLTPKYVVHEEGKVEAFVCTVAANGRESEAVLATECFIAKGQLYKVLKRADCTWFGTDRDLAFLQNYLATHAALKDQAVTPATSVLGPFGDYWIGTDRILSATEWWPMDRAPVRYVNPSKPFVETDYTPAEDTPTLAKAVFALAPRLNRPTVLASVLGWTMACPFKERLWTNYQTRFPVLNVFGTRGSGKTVTVNFIALPLLGVVSHRSHESSTTTYVRLTMLGSTLGLPVSMTEFRADNTFRDAAFAGQLRELYDHATDSRGRGDLSTVQYPLTAPLVIDGEDPLQEAALLERIIQVRLKPETVAPGTEAYTAFREFRQLPVAQLAYSYIQYCLSTTPRLAEAQELTEEALATVPIKSDRVLSNYTLVILGLLHLNDWLDTLGVDPAFPLTPPEVYNLLEESLFNVISKSGRTALLVDDFVTECVNHFAITAGDAKFAGAYNPTTKSVAINLATAYGWWVGERRRQARPILDLRAIKAQLDERALAPDAPVVGQYVLSRDAVCRISGHTFRTFVVDLPAAVAAGLDVPDDLPLALRMEGIG